MLKQNKCKPARLAQSDVIVIDAPASMTSMDVMHKFLSEFRNAGSRRLNTEIYEQPTHAVMTGDTYGLKVWVAPEAEREGRFEIKYEIDRKDAARTGQSGLLRKLRPGKKALTAKAA